jgi:hypothetical protein
VAALDALEALVDAGFNEEMSEGVHQSPGPS